MDAVLSIGEVSRRTGVNTSTLRAWEHRYGLLTPERTAGGHRRYRTTDVARVRSVLQLVERGWAVEAAARHAVEGPAPGGVMMAVEVGERVGPSTSSGEFDTEAVCAAHRAALRLIRMNEPTDAADIVADLVSDLGGEVVTATEADADALDLDISFGSGEPRLPTARAMSLARMRLEFVLPEIVEAARRMVQLLRTVRG